MTLSRAPSELHTFYDGWANYQRLLVAAIRESTADQLAFARPDLAGAWRGTSCGGTLAPLTRGGRVAYPGRSRLRDDARMMTEQARSMNR